MKSLKQRSISIAATALACGLASTMASAQTSPYSYRLPPGAFNPSQARRQPIPITPVQSPVVQGVMSRNGSIVIVRPATTLATPRIIPWNPAGLPPGARLVPPPMSGGGSGGGGGGMPASSGGGSPYGGISTAQASTGPSSGPIGTPIMVQLAPGLGTTATLLRFRAVVTNGVPAQLLSQLIGSGLSYSTPAPIQLCIRGGGRWDIDLLLANGTRLDSIGSFTPTNCP
jgi:hypothetical protein